MGDGAAFSAEEEPHRDGDAEDEGDDEFDEVAIPDLLRGRDQREHRDAPEQKHERNDAPPGHDHAGPPSLTVDGRTRRVDSDRIRLYWTAATVDGAGLPRVGQVDETFAEAGLSSGLS
jgi:hypothetical protein